MRKSKKQLLRTLIACGLVVSVAAGGTVAYLTDAETATNTFTIGRVQIDLEEPGYPGNDSDVIFLLFRKYSLYIANKRYRGNYFFLLFLK